MSKKNNQKNINKKHIAALILIPMILIFIFLLFFPLRPEGITDPYGPGSLSGKNEQEFKDYTYICAFEDETGWNTVISEQYGDWALTACSCSYVEYRKYYGDKDLPKTKTFTGEFPNLKGVEVYDALSIFGDSKIKSKIDDCIEKEIESHKKQ